MNNEPITIYLSNDTRPSVFSNREGLPLTAHQNKERELCLFDLSYDELKPILDGSYLLRQIDDWFCKTASSELHESSQPIEPYFIYPDDTIVLAGINSQEPYTYLRQYVVSERSYYVQQDRPYSSDDICVIPLSFNIDVVTDNIIHPLPPTFKELFDHFPECDFEKEMMTKIIRIEHAPHDKNEIYKARFLLSLIINKTVKNQERCSEAELRFVLSEASIGQMRHHLNENFSVYLSGIGIGSYGCCIDFDQRVATIYNGISDHPARKSKILQIGVGSLGSQLLNNCIKAGFGQWTLVDNDIFLPHNVARHKLEGAW